MNNDEIKEYTISTTFDFDIEAKSMQDAIFIAEIFENKFYKNKHNKLSYKNYKKFLKKEAMIRE